MTKDSIKPKFEELERLFLSLSDKTRLRLLTLMANEPVSVGYLVDELGESQPKVSRHLAYLRNSGVVSTRRDGKWIYYGIQESPDPEVDRVLKFIIGSLSGTTPSDSSMSLDEIDNSFDAVEEVFDYEAEPAWETDREIVEEERHIAGESTTDELEIFLL